MDKELRRFEQYLKRHFGQSKTPKLYLSDLRIFIGIVGARDPEVITPLDIDDFIDHQIAAGLMPSTINRRLACLHTFFEVLASENLEQSWPNPVVWRRHSLKTGTHLPRDVPDDDVASLFAVIDDKRDQAIFGLLLGAGLRVGEVVVVRLGDLEEPSPPVKLAKLRVRGKGEKERIVWLSPSLTETLYDWLEIRLPVNHDYLFSNHHGRPIGVSGIQYRLKQYCQVAGVSFSCHQLRHTFARRLVEHGMPVDSLAKLLGHKYLNVTQRYIDGADPSLRAEFQTAMLHLETSFADNQLGVPGVLQPKSSSPPQPRIASQDELQKLRQKLDVFPLWLREAVDAYLNNRWPTWREQTAYTVGSNFVSVIRQVWGWLDEHRQVEGWDTLRRADLEAWLQARHQEGISNTTAQNGLGQFRSLLKFVEARGVALDPGLFRIPYPKKEETLPRYLPEVDYRRLETFVMQATEADTYHACFDRACFLTLAHTGLRISELLDWRLDDLRMEAGYAAVRGSKSIQDRVVFLTPSLINALERYFNQRPDLPDNDRVFILHERSPSARTIQRRLAEYGQQVDVQVSPHVLRHTLATRLVNQGVPIASLRKLLGHQHLSTTQIYAHIYDETIYKQFSAAMSGLEAIVVEDWPYFERVQPQPIRTDNKT